MELKFKYQKGGTLMKPSTFTIDGADVIFLGRSDGNMEVKFNRVANIASRYGEIQNKMIGILQSNPEVNKDYCLATALLIIMKTGIRIGNEDSAEGYMTVPHPNSKEKAKFVHTYGLTTMKKEHIAVDGSTVKFKFVGKKQVMNYFTLPPALSKFVIKISKMGYDPMFNITEGELTSFIKRETSNYLSAKDFRTFRANVYAYESLKGKGEVETKKEYKEAVKETAIYVSDRLNNTPGVVKKSYIDPRIFDYILGKIKE